MNKVKIWGKEIDNCISCNYCSAYEPRCLIADIDLWNNTLDVHKDCPFSKPVTKEVIEGFGFKYNYKADLENMETPEHSCNSYQYILKDVPFCNSSRSIDLKMTYLGTLNNPNIYKLEMYEKNYFEWYRIFEGRLNNPIELEFILKSIGVIE